MKREPVQVETKTTTQTTTVIVISNKWLFPVKQQTVVAVKK